MQDQHNHIDDLIGKYLAGEASPEEASIVDSWAAENDSNRKYFESLRTIFSHAGRLREWQSFDADAAWRKLSPGLRVASPGTAGAGRTRYLRTFLRVAASVVLLVVAGLAIYRYLDAGSRTVTIVATSAIRADTLPDGTSVHLNKGTSLSYRFAPSKKQHNVRLEGEAYFEVGEHADEDFVVEINGAFIRDIGTRFNVRAYPGTPIAEVTVDDGEVRFYSANDEGVHLRAGMKGVYDRDAGRFSINEPTANEAAYRTRSFSFTGETLGKVIETINGIYEKKLYADDHLLNCRLSVSFNDDSSEEIANVVAETLGLWVTPVSDGFLLKGEKCLQ